MGLPKKTPGLVWRGVFFLWVSLLIGAPVQAGPSVACPAPDHAVAAVVGYVDDGDTVRLTTGERVRLAGIDAPEVAHSAYNDRPAKPAESFGDASRQSLQALLAQSRNRLLVQYGEEPEDRYGRKIAYLFMPDGQSIQAELVAQGMAMAVYMPPNLVLADCLTAIEHQAEQHQVGIWRSAEYSPGIDTAKGVPADVQGAAIIRGKVVSVHQTRKTVWVNLEGRVALQIPARVWSTFNGVDFSTWRGETIKARGWLVPDRNRYQEWRMPIESPRSITVSTR
ncbi:MAG: thermonuclease family protein [Halothiobacillus sp.]